MIVMIMAIYNGIWTPLTISFDWAMREGEQTYFTVIDQCVDIIFYLDIVVGFASSYIDPATGDEIFSPKKIAMHYIAGDFLVDIVSTVPLKEIGVLLNVNNKTFDVLADICSLLKALRIMKIERKIRNLNAGVEDKALMQVIFYGVVIFVYTHIVACVMWYLFKTDQVWVPASDFAYVGTAIHNAIPVDNQDFEHFIL